MRRADLSYTGILGRAAPWEPLTSTLFKGLLFCSLPNHLFTNMTEDMENRKQSVTHKVPPVIECTHQSVTCMLLALAHLKLPTTVVAYF